MKTTNQEQMTEDRINLIFENDVLNTREMLRIKGGDADDDVNHGGSDDQEDGFN